MTTLIKLIKKVFINLLVVQALFSCNSAQEGKTEKNNAASAYSNLPEAILKDYSTWNRYNHKNINLSQDFVGLDKDSKELTKGAFLKLLQTGDYVPFKINKKENEPYYKLVPLVTANKDIKFSIKQLADEELVNYGKEGEVLPNYNWTDLQGNHYTKETTKGKVLVLKCWFIRCVACVKEFPELNELVAAYKNRNDVVFVSLAMDSELALADFLKKKTFRYAVVSVPEPFMVDTLHVRSFPTHIVVGKDGRIAHVSNRYEDLSYALKKELAKG
jgi:thiol-disulfide isomerase/thioredoxin